MPDREASSSSNNSPDERSPLLSRDHGAAEAQKDDGGGTASPPTTQHEAAGAPAPATSVAWTIGALLIGVFVVNTDMSLVLATRGTIASEFEALSDSAWLFTGSLLATCAAQPLFGKLSDVYGPRDVLLFAYLLFVVGCILSGTAGSMGQVVLGRVFAGSGSAGATSIVSILVYHLVSIREVASWRSYVNVLATTGRSIGGPIGGLLADSLGWRAPFLLEIPIMLAAGFLCLSLLPRRIGQTDADTHSPDTGPSVISRLGRIDFPGAALMAGSILALLVPLELGGQEYPWNHPVVIGLLVAAVVAGAAFFLFETYCAKEPVFPPRLLLVRNVWTSYSVMLLQTSAQFGIIYTVPVYFQISARASATSAGLHLVPAFVGNVSGGLLAGALIKRSGRYKVLTISATAIAALAYAVIAIRWRGHTNVWESLYIFPGGFGSGVASSTVFVALAAAVSTSDMAVATSGLYLSMNIATAAGTSVVSAVVQNVLRQALQTELAGMERADVIILNVLRNVNFAATLHGAERAAVVAAYVKSYETAYIVSVSCAAAASFVAFFSKETVI